MQQPTITHLTLAHVKAVITFPNSPGIQASLEGLCDCWYNIALGQGKSENEAARITLDKLGEKLLSMSNT